MAATRRLLDDLATARLAELEARFGAALGQASRRLVGQMALDSFETAQSWFPDTQPREPHSTRAADRRAWGRGVSGAWFRNDDDFAICYQPTRHDDPFLRGWINAAVASDNEALKQFLLKDDNRCTKCHSVDETSQGSVVNWTAFRPPVGNPATRFRHAPHLPLAGEQGCADCHTIRDGDGYLASFGPAKSGADFVPEFAGMTKAQCLPCHEQDQVGGGCIRCHSYHVGNFPPALRK